MIFMQLELYRPLPLWWNDWAYMSSRVTVREAVTSRSVLRSKPGFIVMIYWRNCFALSSLLLVNRHRFFTLKFKRYASKLSWSWPSEKVPRS